METAETRTKLADAIRKLQSSGRDSDVPNLVSAYKAKYQSQPVEEPIQKPTLMQKAGSVIDSIFGGGKIGEAIGTGIGYAMASPEEKKFYDTSIPSAGELAGSALQSASLFTPVGRVAGAIGTGLTKAGLGLGAKTIGNIGAGAVAGEAFDVASNLQQGKTGLDVVKPGLGTAIGGGIPLVGPAVRGVTRLGAESLGVSTGAGYGAIKELFNASAKGGQVKKTAIEALRGQIAPEQIVNEAKGALDQIKQSRTSAYTTSLAQLKENKQSFDISPVIKSVKDNLNKFGVHIGQDGVLDFSRSPIRFDSTAQKDITDVVETMKSFGSQAEDRTVIGLDSLKRAFSDKFSPSSSVRSFVTDVSSSVRDVLKQVPGYDDMATNYAEKTKTINAIQKDLSLGNKVGIDSAFKKLTTVLRTNNEERKVLVEELNAISGGKLVPMIAGQQMSELLPRGIARQIEGFGALGSVVAGFGLPLLKLALVASPRVVGEVVNALGIGKRATTYLLDTLGVKGLVSPGDAILNKAKTLPNKQGGFINPKAVVDDTSNTLLKEARKYKSAEEFVKAQGGVLNIDVPIKDISSSEPSMAYSRLKDAPKRKITEPIEVIHNVNPQAIKDYGEWVVIDGHHRLTQAKINGDKTIKAKVSVIDEVEPGMQNDLTKSQLTSIWEKANKK